MAKKPSSIVTGSINSTQVSVPAIPKSLPPAGPQPVNRENSQVLTDTTTVDRTPGTVLTGVSIIPYMRALAIDFVGYKLRPNREVWFYFDGVGVNRIVQRPNVIETNSSNVVNDIRSGAQKKIKIGNSTARILHVEKNIDTGNAVFYVSEFQNSSSLNANDTITVVNNNSYNSKLIKYHHQSGTVHLSSSNNLIYFGRDADGTTDDYYFGNTITIVNGTKAGQSAQIISYNCATKSAYVEPELDLSKKENGLIYTIGDYRSWYSANVYPSTLTTDRGMVSGVLHIPDPLKNPDSKFKTGEKIFRIVDNPVYGINDPQIGVGNITTKAQYRFVANGLGLDQSKAQIIERNVDVIISVPVPFPTPTATATPTRSRAPVTPTATRTPWPLVSPTPSRTPMLPVSYTPPPSYTRPPPTSSRPRTSPPVTPPSTTPAPSQSRTPSVPPSPSKSKACTPKLIYVGDKDSQGPFGNRVQKCIECCGTCGSIQTEGNHNGASDPIAQSFFISSRDNEDGIFVSSVDLFFKNRGELLPVELQIRPVVNGVPSSDTIIPGATTTVDVEDINVSNFPNTSNSMTATRFTFPSPIFLNSGYEYAIVAITDDYGYDYYSAELGGTVIGTNRVISKQPVLGSFFKSQNGSTWTPLQNEDLMYVINKCEFTSTQGTVVFEEDKAALLKAVSSNPKYDVFSDDRSNTYYDAVELRSDAIEINNTKLNYYFKGSSNATKTLSATYNNFNPDKRFDLEERNILFNPELDNKSLSVRVDMFTTNPDVSPIIYHKRQNLVTIENIINDTKLTEDMFVITNPGELYTENAYVTISSTSGYGANAWAEYDQYTGNISRIVVDSEGTGYVDDVIATIGGGGIYGNGATIKVATETGSSGGPALARYISKTITLLDGFDAGDLRVYLTAVKPPGSNVNVYYKVRNSFDPNPIEDRNWVRMTQKTSQYSFSVNRNPVEYEYRPSLTSNNITYSTDTTTYKTFNQFAIKIVLSSTGTVANAIPYVLDVRAIALPEDVY